MTFEHDATWEASVATPILLKCKMNCGSEFLSFKDMMQHVNLTHLMKTYICDVAECSAGYVKEDGLKRHKRAEHGPKIYRCKPCKVAFCELAQLTRHNKTSDHQRKLAMATPILKCMMKCGGEFGTYEEMLRHVDSAHRNKTYFCDIAECSASFEKERGLRRHMHAKHGPKIYRCETCDVGFCELWYLTVHSKSIAHQRKLAMKIAMAAKI